MMMIFQYDAPPYQTLIAAFLAWKGLLLAIAAGSCVGPSYDTSGSLLLSDGPGNNQSVPTLVTRLTSWDAIYFLQNAKRGYLFEQEWAFGLGLPSLISTAVKGSEVLGLRSSWALEPLMGIIIAHTSHLLSVLVLYQLGWTIWKDRKIAVLAGLLHVLSPAGLFLSAPYQESTYSFLSFTGYLLFAYSCLKHDSSPAARDVLLVLAGVLFGLATTFRSNGLLNGIPFAYEFLRESMTLVTRPSLASARKIVVLGMGGLCVAAGSAIPQFWAYQTYCSGASDGDLRPWCTEFVPSIYSFVQKHYWNTGLFRYWTLSNLPLFLLAAPMLCVLARSGVEFVRDVAVGNLPKTPGVSVKTSNHLASLVQCMALAQTALAALALTGYHVQIITRISSGYPVWYWWLATSLINGQKKKSKLGNGIVIFMVMYASIQGALFASFLPPA